MFWSTIKICHISLLACELWQQCPVPFVLLQMTTKKTDPLLSLFIHVLIAGRGWHRVLLWDQLEGGINIFFSGKANGSNRKHLRTGDRNRSDCIAVTDNVAQACRLREAIYGRKAVKGRGGKFHWTMSLRDGRTHSNSQQLSETTKKTLHIFPLRISDWLFSAYLYLLTLIKRHRWELVREEIITFLANRLSYNALIITKQVCGLIGKGSKCGAQKPGQFWNLKGRPWRLPWSTLKSPNRILWNPNITTLIQQRRHRAQKKRPTEDRSTPSSCPTTLKSADMIQEAGMRSGTGQWSVTGHPQHSITLTHRQTFPSGDTARAPTRTTQEQITFTKWNRN